MLGMGLFYHFNTGGFFHLPFECLQCGTPIVNILISQECDETRILIGQIVSKRSQRFAGELQRPKTKIKGSIQKFKSRVTRLSPGLLNHITSRQI